MKPILIFLFVFTINLIFASSTSYLDYYNKINQAELFIGKLEFDSALTVYESTFKNFSTHFYKDLHNACLCYIKTNKFEKAEKKAEELVLHGYDLTDFNSNSFFDPLIKSSYWEIFKNNYAILHNKYLETLAPEYRKTLFKMFLKDQKAASSRKMNFQDSTFYFQAIELEKLFTKYGFQGCMVNKDTINTKIIIMIRHYFGLVNRVDNDKKMLLDNPYKIMDFHQVGLLSVINKGLNEGLVLPQVYLGMISLWDYTNKYGNIGVLVNFNTKQVTLYLNLPPEKINEINANRTSVGLPEVDKTNPDVLKTTWFSEYPFEEIKNVLTTCDTCSDKDYMQLVGDIEMKVRDSYKTNTLLDGFILTDNSNINSVFYDGMYILQKNKNLKK